MSLTEYKRFSRQIEVTVDGRTILNPDNILGGWRTRFTEKQKAQQEQKIANQDAGERIKAKRLLREKMKNALTGTPETPRSFPEKSRENFDMQMSTIFDLDSLVNEQFLTPEQKLTILDTLYKQLEGEVPTYLHELKEKLQKLPVAKNNYYYAFQASLITDLNNALRHTDVQPFNEIVQQRNMIKLPETIKRLLLKSIPYINRLSETEKNRLKITSQLPFTTLITRSEDLIEKARQLYPETENRFKHIALAPLFLVDDNTTFSLFSVFTAIEKDRIGKPNEYLNRTSPASFSIHFPSHEPETQWIKRLLQDHRNNPESLKMILYLILTRSTNQKMPPPGSDYNYIASFGYHDTASSSFPLSLALFLPIELNVFPDFPTMIKETQKEGEESEINQSSTAETLVKSAEKIFVDLMSGFPKCLCYTFLPKSNQLQSEISFLYRYIFPAGISDTIKKLIQDTYKDRPPRTASLILTIEDGRLKFIIEGNIHKYQRPQSNLIDSQILIYTELTYNQETISVVNDLIVALEKSNPEERSKLITTFLTSITPDLNFPLTPIEHILIAKNEIISPLTN